MKIYKHDGKANMIGPRLIEARKNRKYSQETLATKMQLENIEVTQKIISRIELQERFVTDYELLYFAKVLDVSVEWLLGKED
jgi:transcriptional regulator with XRE-family HTH domain